jgi:cardiolipin synthase
MIDLEQANECDGSNNNIMKLNHIPNYLTTGRILLILPLVYYLLNLDFKTGFWIFFIAGMTDGIDGFLARYFHWTSRLGAFLDPLADKLFMISSYSVLAYLELIPFWLFFIVLIRDIIIMSGVGGVLYIRGEVNFEPSMISKINTVCQIFLAGLILMDAAFYAHFPNLTWLLADIVVITTILSVLGYIIQGIRHVLSRSENQ